jgi:hypothetical protein
MRCAWIKIDIHQLAMRLWRLHGKWLSDLELRQWLKNHGYIATGGNWYTCDGEPAHLEKDEILQSQTRVTENGVTFIADPEEPPSHAPPSETTA